MGFGDVKLAGMIGAFLGPVPVLLTIFVAALLGSLYGAVLLRHGAHRQSKVAFGTFLAASAALSILPALVLLLIGQRYIVSGLTTGALK